MLNHQTVERFKELRLEGMAEAFYEQISQAVTQELSFEERLALLLDREITVRENRRLEKLLRTAKLRQMACIEDIDYKGFLIKRNLQTRKQSVIFYSFAT